jgi:hemolysin activation/secretion protein
MTSPDHLSQVSILGLGYRLPMYSWGGSFDFSASHSTVDSGTVAQPGGGANLAISGSGDVFGVRYTHNLNSSSDWQHKASVGLEERFYGNSVTPTGGSTSLVPNLTTQPLTLGYSGNWRSPARELNWSANWLINIPGGSGGSTRDFNQSGGRAGSKAEFQTLKFSLQHTERYASQWVFRAGLTGQYTEDLLIAAEQFGVGGADSVRGFGEREVAADQGVRLGFETWAPPLDISDWRLVFLGFLDSAMVWRNQPLPGEISEQNISSVGLGLRVAWGRNLSGRLDWGYVLQGVKAPVGTTVNGALTGDNKMHATLIWVF